MKERLVRIERETINVIKEALDNFNNPAIFWAGGKDSTTMLYVMKKILGDINFPVIVLDTNYEFQETLDFMNRVAKQWKLNLIKVRNTQNIIDEKDGCCAKFKIDALSKILKNHNFDGVFVGIRKDEHSSRSIENFFSYREYPPHFRIHPLLNWSEDDIWEYTQSNNIQQNPLYNLVVDGNLFYRSIGCRLCTKPIQKLVVPERAGRGFTKEGSMEKFRSIGYF